MTGDGVIAAFPRDFVICLANTSVPDVEECIDRTCLGVYVSSVTLSPHGDLVGFVLLDDSFYPDNVINILALFHRRGRRFRGRC